MLYNLLVWLKNWKSVELDQTAVTKKVLNTAFTPQFIRGMLSLVTNVPVTEHRFASKKIARHGLTMTYMNEEQ